MISRYNEHSLQSFYDYVIYVNCMAGLSWSFIRYQYLRPMLITYNFMSSSYPPALSSVISLKISGTPHLGSSSGASGDSTMVATTVTQSELRSSDFTCFPLD